MEVKLFANLAETAGTRELEVPIDEETTVASVLERVFETTPALRSDVLDEANRPHDHISILVNGRSLSATEALDESVAPEDELALFPPVSGG